MRLNLSKNVIFLSFFLAMNGLTSTAQVNTVATELICEGKPHLDELRGNYETNFRSSSPNRYTQYAFLDYSYFRYIDNFFKQSTQAGLNYDGVRVYLGVYNSMLYKEYTKQIDPLQITFVLAPTINKKGKLDAFRPNAFKILDNPKSREDALNHGELCLNACGDVDPVGKRTTQLTIDRYPFIHPDSAEKFINNYQMVYRSWNPNSHTSSVFIPRGTFHMLKAFLDHPSYNRFLGFKFFLVSYNRGVPDVGSVVDNQLSLLVVPVNNLGKEDHYSLNQFFGTTGTTYQRGHLQLSNDRQ